MLELEKLIETIESMYRVEKNCAEMENDHTKLLFLETIWSVFNTTSLQFPTLIDTSSRLQHLVDAMHGYVHNPDFARLSVLHWTQQFLEENEDNPIYENLVKPFDSIYDDITFQLVG